MKKMIWLLCAVIFVVCSRDTVRTTIVVETFEGNATFSELTENVDSVSINNDKKSFSSIVGQRMPNVAVNSKEGSIPLHSTWPTPVHIASVVTAKPPDVLQMWSEFIAFITKRDARRGYSERMTEDAHQCKRYEDCQQYLERSLCRQDNGRRVCSCSSDYVKYGNKCLIKVLNGGACNHSIQCIAKTSICHGGYCRCFYGKEEDSCVYVYQSKRGSQNILLPVTVIILVIAISVVLCTASGILISRRFISRTLPTHCQRRRTISETCAQSTDKPPAYDEVISTPQTLSIEELNQIPPPSYDTIRQFQQPTAASN